METSSYGHLPRLRLECCKAFSVTFAAVLCIMHRTVSWWTRVLRPVLKRNVVRFACLRTRTSHHGAPLAHGGGWHVFKRLSLPLSTLPSILQLLASSSIVHPPVAPVSFLSYFLFCVHSGSRLLLRTLHVVTLLFFLDLRARAQDLSRPLLQASPLPLRNFHASAEPRSSQRRPQRTASARQRQRRARP